MQSSSPSSSTADRIASARPQRRTKAKPAAATGAFGRVAAATLPVASVMVDVPLPHLDRPFDFLIPSDLDQMIAAGSRVRVRFAGRLVDAHVLERRESSDHVGKLAFVERAVGAVPLLTAETIALVRAVADRWGGTFADVVRLAVPGRHARAENGVLAAVASAATGSSLRSRDPSSGMGERARMAWARYSGGDALLQAVEQGRDAPTRAAWAALPGEDWPTRLAELARAALEAGSGSILIVPDARDLRRLDAAMTAELGEDRHVALSADLGPAERYKRWWMVRQGVRRVVIGTRSAAYAPVADLGLLVLWDDGDDLHNEPRAPYPHTRDVLVLRTTQQRCSLVLAGFTHSTEAAYLVERRWIDYVGAPRDTLRAHMPRVSAAGDDFELARDPAARSARLPDQALRAARAALQADRPVLIQVPRRGYLPAVACVRDRVPARCPNCHGPLALSHARSAPECRWCGRIATGWRCPECGGMALRAVVVGAGRTAEELGRAFPGIAVRTSSGDRILEEAPGAAGIVVATAGAEPVADGGYGAALLLDAWALLSRPELTAGEEALRRWINAAALVRAGGDVVIMADAALAVVQALIRWAPGGFAERELADRKALIFPPYARLATITGPSEAVAELAATTQLPAGAEIIGTVSLPTTTSPTTTSPAGGESDPQDALERMIIRAPRAAGTDLALALRTAAAGRSARRSAVPVRIQLDPTELF